MFFSRASNTWRQPKPRPKIRENSSSFRYKKEDNEAAEAVYWLDFFLNIQNQNKKQERPKNFKTPHTHNSCLTFVTFPILFTLLILFLDRGKLIKEPN